MIVTTIKQLCPQCHSQSIVKTAKTRKENKNTTVMTVNRMGH